MPSTNRSPYWIFQLTGWGAVAAYWFYFSVRHLSVPWALLDACTSAVVMIAITDVYRRVVHKQGWLALPPARLPLMVAGGYFLLLAAYMLQAYLTYQVKVGGPYYGSVALGALAGGSRYIAIWLLAFHLYHYARQTASQRAAIAEARLARLSNDLNPHFLFNALNGIRALTRENPARARDAIDRLSALLRYALAHGNQPLVPLTEEVAIIREYLALEKIRLEERLTVHWELPPDYSECEIPPLSLHTLVDNAVKHGVARLPEGGTIIISLLKTAGGWVFTVTNPCSSIPDSGTRAHAPSYSVGARAHRIKQPRSESPPGTGLKNLRQRLMLQYGNAAHLTFLRTESVAEATLTIPL